MLKGPLSGVYESESISHKKNVLNKNRKKYDVIAGVGNTAKTKETSLRTSLCSRNESSVMCFSGWRFLQTPARILIQKRNISPPLGSAGSATASVQQHEQRQDGSYIISYSVLCSSWVTAKCSVKYPL